jgi:hypothetical protein
LDREDDHGEEIEGEEEIHQEEGRSGPQEEENSKIGGEKVREESREESREEGSSEAQGSGKETGPCDTSGGTRSCPGLAPAGRFRIRRKRQHLRLFPLAF